MKFNYSLFRILLFKIHFVLLTVTIISQGCASVATNLKPVKGQIAPTFYLPRYEGGSFYLSRIVGPKAKPSDRRPVILSFFQTSCIPCKAVISELGKIKEEFPEVSIYLVNINETDDLVSQFLENFDVELEVLMDKYGAASRKFGVVDESGLANLPSAFIIAPSGIVVSQSIGFRPGDEIIIKQELAEMLGRPLYYSDMEKPKLNELIRPDKIGTTEDIEQLNIALLELDAFGISNNEAISLSNRLRIELFKTKRFIVLERGNMQKILEEQDFQQTGCTTTDCMVEVGKLLNVQQIIAGSISKVGDIYSIEIRLVDVATAKIIAVATEDVRGPIGDLLTSGIRNVAFKLIESE